MVGISFLMKSLLRECIFIKRIRRVLNIIPCFVFVAAESIAYESVSSLMCLVNLTLTKTL